MGPINTDGLGFFILLGVITWIAALVAVPPGVIAAIAWFFSPVSGLDPVEVWLKAQGVWVAFIAVMVAVIYISERVGQRRRHQRHVEFMTLRDLFYRRDEVCCETLESLRERAVNSGHYVKTAGKRR